MNDLNVNRLYSSWDAIRLYQDRGMEKWMGMYLSDHTAALKDFTKDSKAERAVLVLDLEEKVDILSQAFLNQMKIVVQLKERQLEGVVYAWQPDNSILFRTGGKFNKLTLSEIYNIFDPEIPDEFAQILFDDSSFEDYRVDYEEGADVLL